MKSAVAALIILMFSAGAIVAQEVVRQGESYTVSVDVQFVQLPVSVLDKDGNSVSGLERDHFQVFENGTLQEISLFKHEDVPLSVGLLIDTSGSMWRKRASVNRAAVTFAQEGNPDDETFIVSFDQTAYLEQDFTNSIDDLTRVLDRLDTKGQTALYDALFLGAGHLNEGTKDKRALLVISDGEDNASKYGLIKVLAKLRESKGTVYAIGLIGEKDRRGGLFRASPSKRARAVLEKIAGITGGRAYFPKSVDDVEELCRRIAHDLRGHYTLGYTSSNKKMDGSWRKITVRLNPPKALSKLTVRAREGYYSPIAQDITER